MRVFLPVALALALGACSTTPTAVNVSQTLEKADTDASLAYVAVASSVNAYEGITSITAQQRSYAESLKVKAWGYLMAERKAYALGQSFDISGILALATMAAQLGH